MKTIFLFLFVIYYLGAQSQNVSVSSLPAATTLNTSDFFPIVQNGRYHKAYISQIDSACGTENGVWGLTGNSSTNPATDFIGTTDNTNLILKRDGYAALNLLSEQGYGNAVTITDSIGNTLFMALSNDSGNVYQINIGDVFQRYTGTLFGINVAQKVVGCRDSVFIDEGAIQITDGTQGAGKVLTSNANGLASWQQISNQDTVVTDTITNAQILNSNTSPVTLLPAPGSGWQWNVISVQGYYNFGTTAFMGAGGNVGLIQGDIGYLLDGQNSVIGNILSEENSTQFKDVLGRALESDNSVSLYNQPVQLYTNGLNPSLGDGYFTLTIIAMKTH